MTREKRVIGSSITLAKDYLESAQRLGTQHRGTSEMICYSAENLLKALFVAEGMDFTQVRAQSGNHLIDRMLDHLPDACAAKADLRTLEAVSAYSTTTRYTTPSGAVPRQPTEAEIIRWIAALERAVARSDAHFSIIKDANGYCAANASPLRQ